MSNNLKTTTAEADARFLKSVGDIPVTHQTSDEESRIVWREWPNIDATVADTLATTMLGVTEVTDPQMDGQTFTGKFANADVVVSENDRRWVTIQQKLIRITTVASSSDLPAPLDIGKEELYRAFQYEAGSGTVRAREYKYLDRDSETACLETITDTQLLNLLGDTAYTVEERQWTTEARGDRTCTLLVLFRKVAWTNISGDTPATQRHTSQAGEHSTDVTAGGNNYYGRTRRETSFGVPKDDAETALETLATNSDDDNWSVEDVRLSEGANGEATLSRRRQYANQNTAIADAIVYRRERDVSQGANVGVVLMWPDLRPAEARALISTIRTQASFVVDGETYLNAGHRGRFHPRTGLHTIFQTGVRLIGSRWARAVTGTKIIHQRFKLSDDEKASQTGGKGTMYRVTTARRVGGGRVGAAAFADNSSYKAPEGSYSLKDGWWGWDDKLGKYVSYQIKWEAGKASFNAMQMSPDDNSATAVIAEL